MIKGKRILIIAPHPDDEAICCGGLIMLAKKQRSKVYVLYGSVGLSRQLINGQTNPHIRKNEAKKAAVFGGFDHSIIFEGIEFMKLDAVPQKTLIDAIEDKVSGFKPDIVCLPFRNSFDQDHRALFNAAVTALRPIPKNLRHQPATILEAEEPYSWTTGEPFHPNFFVDISAVFDEKIKLLKCHKTQLRKDPFPRSVENLKRLAGMRGAEIGAKYAEGYRLIKTSV